MLRFMIVLSLIFMSSSIYCGTIDPSTPDQKYVEYGSKFHNVVRLCCVDKDKIFSCGSGVVYTKHWVITAAHVVHNCSDWAIKVGDKKYEISKVIVHKDYKDNVFGANDIALCYLEEPVLLDFYPELYDDKDEVGKVCCMSGWGFSGTFNSGATFSDGKRRAGSNIIDRTERSVLVCSPSRRHEKCTEMEFLIASGDSGGGLFINDKLAGINSSVLAIDKKPDSSYTDESCHTRISLYVPWIYEHTKHEKK